MQSSRWLDDPSAVSTVVLQPFPGFITAAVALPTIFQLQCLTDACAALFWPPVWTLWGVLFFSPWVDKNSRFFPLSSASFSFFPLTFSPLKRFISLSTRMESSKVASTFYFCCLILITSGKINPDLPNGATYSPVIVLLLSTFIHATLLI